MSTRDRSGLKAAFSGFKKLSQEEAEKALLGRSIDPPAAGAAVASQVIAESYQVATSTQTTQLPSLTPRPLLQREPVRQVSFRCPVSLASLLRRKAAFNQLEQQEIMIEGLKRVLDNLPSPPAGWEE